MINYFDQITKVLKSRDEDFTLSEETEKQIKELVKELNVKDEKKGGIIWAGLYGLNDNTLFINSKNIEKKIGTRKVSAELKKMIQSVLKSKTDDEKDTLNNLYLKDCLIYIFVSSIKEKIRIKSLVASSLNVRYIFVPDKQIDNKEYTITIDNRNNTLRKSTKHIGEKSYMTSEVFVARLYDLIQLYNGTGDKLFDSNVRLGLSSDTNGVAPAMIETLKKEPQNFWFYNNGITIIADRISLIKRDSITLRNTNYYSVINGAQTITTCAEYFLKEISKERVTSNGDTEDNPDYLEWQKAVDNAYVLLRVISARTKLEKEKEEEKEDKEEKYIRNELAEEKVSVSLNRQKPIDGEDLAYVTDYVKTINGLRENAIFKDKLYSRLAFSIARKGDDLLETRAYSLGTIGKIIYATKFQKPGSAKNQDIPKLTRMDKGKLINTNIFVDIDDEASEDKIKSTFLENYGMVNFSRDILKKWDKNAKHYLESFESEKNIDNNGEYKKYGNVLRRGKVSASHGNYLFLAFVTWSLFSNEDFVDVNTTIHPIVVPNIIKLNEAMNSDIDSYIFKLLEVYFDLIESYLKKSDETLTEKDFKSDVLYTDIDNLQDEELNGYRDRIRRAVFDSDVATDDEDGDTPEFLLDLPQTLVDMTKQINAELVKKTNPNNKGKLF
ncbi:AIPR family protein [Pseudobutyrivibrio ruminis]|uniref:AIPR protein n=1 Tax=Pseudobutyrivibrio ruminis DSM 9787 TaxID=1123011 RepID=A0A285REM9_9FIRM|nr:AIPR family protein [Pseudobutyrivibrio ruminis]SOB92521.1 AIPR protein [Pseudobutyrivibrio ruminis DSM 9787]